MVTEILQILPNKNNYFTLAQTGHFIKNFFY